MKQNGIMSNKIFQLFLFFFLINHITTLCMTITSGQLQGVDCFIITTNQAKFYYQKESGSFSRIDDLSLLDWIDAKTTADNYIKGCPVLNSTDSIGVLGSRKCTSIQMNDSTIKTTSKDNLWEWTWTFTECRARCSIVAVPKEKTYSFQYCGVPFIKSDTSLYCVSNNSTPKKIDAAAFSGSWQWMAIGSTKNRRLLVMTPSLYPDSLKGTFRRIKQATSGDIIRAGFGIDSEGKPLLTQPGMSFTLSFLELSVSDTTTQNQVNRIIRAIMSPVITKPIYGIAVSSHWKDPSNLGGWGDIVRHDIENDSVVNRMTLYTGDAFFPKLNIEGTEVAFIHRSDSSKSGAICVMNIDGSNVRLFTNTLKGACYLNWPNGRWIYYCAGENTSSRIQKINVDNGVIEDVVTLKDNDNKDTHPWLLSMSANNKRMVFRASNYSIYYCKMPETTPQTILLKTTGGIYNCPDGLNGCQHALSANGEYMSYGPATDLHETIRIKAWWDYSLTGCIALYTAKQLHTWKPSAQNSGGEFYNNRWASNSDDWICVSEILKSGTFQVSNFVLYNWRQQQQLVVSANTGDGQIHDAAGDFHVDTSLTLNQPIMRLSSYLCTFEADSGIGACIPQEIKAWNAGFGTLQDLSTVIRYEKQSQTQWLSVTKSSGIGNQQTLLNTVAIPGLSGGTHTAYVTVSSPNASISKTYKVQLKILTTKLFSKVLITPATSIIEPKKSIAYRAQALNQYNDTIAVDSKQWKWEVDTPATISQNGLFFCSKPQPTPFTIKASITIDSSTRTGTATALVEPPALTVLTPNGTETYTVGLPLIVMWRAFDTSRISSVAIDLSIDNGKKWSTINVFAISPKDSVWGVFKWTIPPVITLSGVQTSTISDSCLIKVRDYQFASYKDVSDYPFQIKESITASTPGVACRAQPGIFRTRAQQWIIQAPANQKYSLKIFSLKGQSLISYAGIGPFSKTLSNKDLPMGVYLVKLHAGMRTIQSKIMIY